MIQIDAAHKYQLDDLERICPVHQMGSVRERWQNAGSFDEAMEGVAALAMSDIFPDEGLTLEAYELRDLQAKRYLDIKDGFYLATGIDADSAVFRFMWQDEIFFSIRPDFVLRSLASHLSEPPINALESAIRDRLIDYHQELDALKYALARGEIEDTGVYPLEWWVEFWRVRGIFAPDPASAAGAGDKPLKTTERNTLLSLIAVLCDYSAIDLSARGTAVQIAKLSEEFGADVSSETVRRVIAMIPDALETRKK